MNKSKLTIAIPTYNREEFLKQCLDSIKNQTFTEYKVLVFDNCSNYDVFNLVDKYGEKFEVIKNQNNIGNLGNFDKIFSYPFDTPYVMVLHDDDTVYPCYVKKAVLQLEMNDDIVWIGGIAHFVKDYSKMFSFKNNKFHWEKCNQDNLLKYILRNYNIVFDSLIYKKEAVKSISKHQEIYDKWCDRPYIIDLINNKKILITKNPVINYRIHKNQDSQSNTDEKLEYWWNLLKFYESKSVNNKSLRVVFKKWAMSSIILSLMNFTKSKKEYLRLLNTKPYSEYISFKFITVRSLFYFLRNIIK